MTPAENIISKLGGTRRAAALIGVPPSTVQSWKESGFIPARRQGHVLEVAAGNGIDLLASDFMTTPALPPDDVADTECRLAEFHASNDAKPASTSSQGQPPLAEVERLLTDLHKQSA
jgi:DNA-binding transcriptional regulator YdaS (Cro superfamily)